jgi:hypothetical protein
MNYSLELAEDPVDKSCHQMVGRREKAQSILPRSTFSRVQIAHLLFRINPIDFASPTLGSRRTEFEREKQIKKPKSVQRGRNQKR